MTRPAWRVIIPQVAVVAPIVAFAVDGTAVPIGHATEDLMQWATWPILALVAWSLVSDHRFWRTMSGVAMILWWATFIAVLVSVTNPRTSWFGMLSLAAIPVVIAFTWGQAWGVHDIRERDDG